MFALRLIIFLFVAGSLNVLFLLIAYSLPALHGWHAHALAVGVAFLLIADAIFLYIVFFRWESMKKIRRYQKFEEILDEERSDDEYDEEVFERAYRKWEES